jgi:hypothetical protein
MVAGDGVTDREVGVIGQVHPAADLEAAEGLAGSMIVSATFRCRPPGSTPAPRCSERASDRGRCPRSCAMTITRAATPGSWWASQRAVGATRAGHRAWSRCGRARLAPRS